MVHMVLGFLVPLPSRDAPPPHTQVRAEFLGAILVALLLLVPEIEERLKDAQPGKGRLGAQAVAGAENGFVYDKSLPEPATRVSGHSWCLSHGSAATWCLLCYGAYGTDCAVW